MIFVDTGYWIALLDDRDELHERALAWAALANGTMISTDTRPGTDEFPFDGGSIESLAAEHVFWRCAMKTSLLLDDHVHRLAGEASRQSGKSLSEVISEWARMGCELSRKKARTGRRGKLPSVDLGRPARVDLSCRRDWMEMLER